MDTRTLAKTFVRYTHLNLLHEHNVIYAKETYLLCLFERSFDDDNDDLNSTNLSKRGTSRAPFECNYNSLRAGSIQPLWREPDLVWPW